MKQFATGIASLIIIAACGTADITSDGNGNSIDKFSVLVPTEEKKFVSSSDIFYLHGSPYPFVKVKQIGKELEINAHVGWIGEIDIGTPMCIRRVKYQQDSKNQTSSFVFAEVC